MKLRCLVGALQLALIQWSWSARIKSTHRADNTSNADAVKVKIFIENDTPYDIDDLVVIHKYNGLPAPHPKTHVLIFSDVGSKAYSAPQKVLTEIGWNALREDWWILSWRFKHRVGQRCPCCAKEDNSCETWITDPANSFGQFFMDPVSYVKIAGAIVNTVTTGLSLGTVTVASVAATTVLTDVVTDVLTADDNTDGFKACGLNSIDYYNSEAGHPVKIRISPNFKEGDYVTWVGSDATVPEGIVGKVVELLDDPKDQFRVRAEFPISKKTTKIYRFKVGSLRFTFRPKDIVSKIGNSSDALGQVVDYSPEGLVGVKFGSRKEYHKASALQPHPKSDSDPGGGIPEFKVEMLLYEEGTKEHVKGEGAASHDVRWGCITTAKAMPCVVNSVAPEGKHVPVTVVNRGSKTIKSFAVLHRYNGLDPPVHIVDSDTPLPVGSSSWVKPKRDSATIKHSGSYCDGSKTLATTGTTVLQCQALVQEDSDCRELFHSNGKECLCVRPGGVCNVRTSKIGNNVYALEDKSIIGKRLVVNSERAPILAAVNSNHPIGSLPLGSSVTAAGSPTKGKSGEMVVSIRPHGAVPWALVDVLDHPDPSAVLTDTGFGFHNDWWTVAWTYEGNSEEVCEVRTAMNMDFLSELVNNPEQKLLNVGVAITNLALGVPVLWSGAIDVGKYSVEKIIRNQNDLDGNDPKPAHKLFGINLLNLLASTSSVRGYEKCNLNSKDVEDAEKGKPLQIIIYDDHVEILADGGQKKCTLATAELSCLHSAECFETDTCKRLNERTEFAKPAAIG